jgi:hypothetical protein
VVLWTIIAESSDWTAVAEMAARQEQSAAVGDKEGEEEETRRETEKPARQVFLEEKTKLSSHRICVAGGKRKISRIGRLYMVAVELSDVSPPAF